jgi:hypothetical protein
MSSAALRALPVVSAVAAALAAVQWCMPVDSRVRGYEVAIVGVAILCGGVAYVAMAVAYRFVFACSAVPAKVSAGNILLIVTTGLWASFTPLAIAFAVPRGAFVAAYRQPYDAAYAPAPAAAVMRVMAARQRFCLVDGIKGTGKSEFGVHVARLLLARHGVAMTIHVEDAEGPLHAIARTFGVSIPVALRLLRLWAWQWGEAPTVVFDVGTKDTAFSAATFRSKVKLLVAEEQLIHALIVASEGRLFGQLTDEPRLTTFKATELPIDDARRFLRQHAGAPPGDDEVTAELLRTIPRTLQKILSVADDSADEPWAAILFGQRREYADLMDNVRAAFHRCRNVTGLLRVAAAIEVSPTASGPRLTWPDVVDHCGNVYGSMERFNVDAARPFNLFYPTSASTWRPQFDVVRRAMAEVADATPPPKCV